VKRKGESERFVGRRYRDFAVLHKQLRNELPGKVPPPLPKKNKTSTTVSGLFSRTTDGADESDASSLSSTSTMPVPQANGVIESMKSLSVQDHRKSGQASPRPSIESRSSPSPALKAEVSNAIPGEGRWKWAV
jgi:hypothetical protein